MLSFKSAISIAAISILLGASISYGQSASVSVSSFDFSTQIRKYEGMLLLEPANCFYLSQIANSYQALNEFNNSIRYYQKALAQCPDDLFNIFQLGVSHYLIMKKDKGIEYMDSAIDGAEKTGDLQLMKMFKGEKKAWLENWDKVLELDWNKK